MKIASRARAKAAPPPAPDFEEDRSSNKPAPDDRTVVTVDDGARVVSIRSMLNTWLRSLPDGDIDERAASPLQVALRAISEALHGIDTVEGVALILARGLVDTAEQALWRRCAGDIATLAKADLEATIGEALRLLEAVQVQQGEASPQPRLPEAQAVKTAPDNFGEFRTNHEAGWLVPGEQAVAPPALLLNPDATALSFVIALRVRQEQVASIVEQGCMYGDPDLGAYAGSMTQPVEEMELLIEWLETLLRGGRPGAAR